MITAQSIMKSKVITVTPQTPIFDALQLLSRYKISGMPVINSENEVVGLLSEKDVLRLLIDKNSDHLKTVESYMSRDVISFHENDDVVEICKFFIRANVRRVPIINAGKLVGIVSRRDILESIIDAKTQIAELRYA
jgi:CBS domain-containing protein